MAGVLAILMAMTIGAETMSVLTNKRSSTAERLPGEAWRLLRSFRGWDVVCRTYLLIQDELGGFLALAGFRSPYFDFELLTGQSISEKALSKTFAEGDARQASASAKVLDDRVGAEDVSCDIECVWSVHGVVFAAEEEPDGPRVRRFGWQLGKERAEAGM